MGEGNNELAAGLSFDIGSILGERSVLLSDAGKEANSDEPNICRQTMAQTL